MKLKKKSSLFTTKANSKKHVIRFTLFSKLLSTMVIYSLLIMLTTILSGQKLYGQQLKNTLDNKRFSAQDIQTYLDSANNTQGLTSEEWLLIVEGGTETISSQRAEEIDAIISIILGFSYISGDNLRSYDDKYTASKSKLDIEKDEFLEEWKEDANTFIQEELKNYLSNQVKSIQRVDNNEQNLAYDQIDPQVTQYSFDQNLDDTKDVHYYTSHYYTGKSTWDVKWNQLFGAGGRKENWINASDTAISNGIREWDTAIQALKDNKTAYDTAIGGLITNWQTRQNAIDQVNTDAKENLSNLIESFSGYRDQLRSVQEETKFDELISNLKILFANNGSMIDVANVFSSFWGGKIDEAQEDAENAYKAMFKQRSIQQDVDYAMWTTSDPHSCCRKKVAGVCVDRSGTCYTTSYHHHTDHIVYKAIDKPNETKIDWVDINGFENPQFLNTLVYQEGGIPMHSIADLTANLNNNTSYKITSYYKVTDTSLKSNYENNAQKALNFENYEQTWKEMAVSLQSWYDDIDAFNKQKDTAIATLQTLRVQAAADFDGKINSLKNQRDDWLWSVSGKASDTYLSDASYINLMGYGVENNDSQYNAGLSIWNTKQSDFNTARENWFKDALVAIHNAATFEFKEVIDPGKQTVKDLVTELHNTSGNYTQSRNLSFRAAGYGNFSTALYHIDKALLFSQESDRYSKMISDSSLAISKSYERAQYYKTAEKDALVVLQKNDNIAAADTAINQYNSEKTAWKNNSTTYANNQNTFSAYTSDLLTKKTEIEKAVIITTHMNNEEMDLLRKAKEIFNDAKKFENKAAALKESNSADLDAITYILNQAKHKKEEARKFLTKGYKDISGSITKLISSNNLTFTKTAVEKKLAAKLIKNSETIEDIDNELKALDSQRTKTIKMKKSFDQSISIIQKALTEQKKGHINKVTLLLDQAKKLANTSLDKSLSESIETTIASIITDLPQDIDATTGAENAFNNAMGDLTDLGDDLDEQIKIYNEQKLPDISVVQQFLQLFNTSMATANIEDMIAFLNDKIQGFEDMKRQWVMQTKESAFDAVANILDDPYSYSEGDDDTFVGVYDKAYNGYFKVFGSREKFENYAPRLMDQAISMDLKIPNELDVGIKLNNYKYEDFYSPDLLADPDYNPLSALMTKMNEEMTRINNEITQVYEGYMEAVDIQFASLEPQYVHNNEVDVANQQLYIDRVQDSIKDAVEDDTDFTDSEEFMYANIGLGLIALGAAPFTGGASIALYAGLQAGLQGQDAYEQGGWLGLTTCLVSSGINGTVGSYTGGAVQFNMQYTKDGGFTGSVSGGYGVTGGVDFSEDGMEGYRVGLGEAGTGFSANFDGDLIEDLQDGSFDYEGIDVKAGNNYGGATMHIDDNGNYQSTDVQLNIAQDLKVNATFTDLTSDDMGFEGGSINFTQTMNPGAGVTTKTSSTFHFDKEGNYDGITQNYNTSIDTTESYESINEGLSTLQDYAEELFNDTDLPENDPQNQDPFATGDHIPANIPNGETTVPSGRREDDDADEENANKELSNTSDDLFDTLMEEGYLNGEGSEITQGGALDSFVSVEQGSLYAYSQAYNEGKAMGMSDTDAAAYARNEQAAFKTENAGSNGVDLREMDLSEADLELGNKTVQFFAQNPNWNFQNDSHWNPQLQNETMNGDTESNMSEDDKLLQLLDPENVLNPDTTNWEINGPGLSALDYAKLGMRLYMPGITTVQMAGEFLTNSDYREGFINGFENTNPLPTSLDGLGNYFKYTNPVTGTTALVTDLISGSIDGSLDDARYDLINKAEDYGTHLMNNPHELWGFTDGFGAGLGLDVAAGEIVFNNVPSGGVVDEGVDVIDNLDTDWTNKKLNEYLLNKDHPVGGSKAKWFDEALGFDKSNVDQLSNQIIFDEKNAIPTVQTEYGQKYNQVISITGANGREIDVTFAWIKHNDGTIKLITAIPTKR